MNFSNHWNWCKTVTTCSIKTHSYSSYRLYNTIHGAESPCVKCLCGNLRQCPWKWYQVLPHTFPKIYT